jgi:hypothetical protein
MKCKKVILLPMKHSASNDSSLNASRIYFSSHTEHLIEEFYHWDNECSVMRIGDLPEINAWWTWERKLLSAMKKELGMSHK